MSPFYGRTAQNRQSRRAEYLSLRASDRLTKRERKELRLLLLGTLIPTLVLIAGSFLLTGRGSVLLLFGSALTIALLVLPRLERALQRGLAQRQDRPVGPDRSPRPQENREPH